MKVALTDIAVKRLKSPEKGQLKVWDTKTPGFGIIVGKRTKTFTVVYGEDRKNQSIGRYPDLSLKEAREQAKVILAQKSSQNGSQRLSGAIQDYYRDCEARIRPNTLREYKRHLNKAPDVKIDDFGRDDIDTTDGHCAIAWKVFYNWLVKQDITDRNPFAHIPFKTGTRARVLTNDEIKAVWAYNHPPFSDMLKLLLLTGQRRNQIWKLNPDWIADGLIHFPAEIMKNGEAHDLPLGTLTKKLVKKAPFVFNSWSKSKERLDKKVVISDWRIHDLRRTMATIHASLGTPVHVVEALLAHKSGSISGVAAIYNRYDYLKEAKEAVAKYERHFQTIIAQSN